MVLSPENPYIDQNKDENKNWDEICASREKAARKSENKRTGIIFKINKQWIEKYE